MTEPTSSSGTKRGESGPVRSIIELETESARSMMDCSGSLLPVKSMTRSLDDDRSGNMETLMAVVVNGIGEPV